MFDDILPEAGATVAYGAAGIVLMAFGYLIVEVTTPGRLGDQIWVERNRGAGLILAAKLLGVGAIVTTAIVTSENGLSDGLVSTLVYGVLGIVLMTAAFFMLDLITPGKLGATLVGDSSTTERRNAGPGTAASEGGEGSGIVGAGRTEDRPIHPACWVVAATDLATAAIVAAAIT